MRLLSAYSRRYERKRRLLSAALRGRDLRAVRDRTRAIRQGAILCAAVIRNEGGRLAFWLDHHRRLGVDHFLIVDNGSTDEGPALLEAAEDVSLWRTEASYRRANFGMHWVNRLARLHAAGHWLLTLDPDEFLVYPHCDARGLRALTDHLSAHRRRAFGALLLDLYGAGPGLETPCAPGADPIAAAPYFDTTSYFFRRDERYRNLWIQGGPRLRAFFADDPGRAPALNKIPLVRWERGFAYVSSTHALLPRGLNLTYDEGEGERLTGVLLHAKFIAGLKAKAEEELARRQHFGGSREYRAYAAAADKSLMTPDSVAYEDWRQLERLGLMARGGWL